MVQVPKSLLQLASFLSSFMYHSDANSPITGATGGGDPCISLFSSGPIATVSAVEACYNIFPATVNQKQSQITFMKQMFSIYPYTELAKNSHIHKGNIYPMKFNFMQELDQIPANPTIDTEYKLTQAILKLITKLEDGHVKYMPLCFMSYPFLQPFNLQPVYQKDGTMDIVIESPNKALPDLFLSYWKDALRGHDVARLIGALGG
ncbi:hypothetical protein BC830DRAFT_287531 [Chytriomyces sp. MP71]|nr:hypothetical protein BC830DRAFT_287531 [Chytriomyces sp. MP71]